MSQDPGLFSEFFKSIRGFILRLLNWIFAKSNHEPDSEAQIDLPTKIIYGDGLPSWSPGNSGDVDDSQPMRHSEEWALQKAQFLRSPPLKKELDSRGIPPKVTRISSTRAYSSQISVEYHRAPSEDYSQDSTLPPTIRVEDWSSPPSPQTQYPSSESLNAANLTLSRSNPGFTNPNRDSLAVPTEDWPRFSNDRNNSKVKRTTVAMGNRNNHSIAYSKNTQNRRQKNDLGPKEARRSSLEPFPNLAARGSKPKNPASLSSRSRCTSKPHLSSIARDPTATDSSVNSSERIKETVYSQNVDNSVKAIHRGASIGTSQHRQRALGKPRLTAKRHHSQPFSTIAAAPLRGANSAINAHPMETHTHQSKERADFYRHSIDVVGLPFLTGVTSSSDIQTTIITRPHQEDIREISDEMCFDFRRRLTSISIGKENASGSTSSRSVDVPYPEVFNLDEYLEGFSPPANPSTAVPSLNAIMLEYSPHSEGMSSPLGSPTPGSRTPPSKNRLVTQASDSSYLRHGPVNNIRGAGETKDKDVASRKATPPVRNPALGWSSGTDDDEQSLSRSEYSVESYSSSADIPLADLLSRRLGGRDEPNFHKWEGSVIGSGATSKPSLASGPGCTVVSSDSINRTKPAPCIPKENLEMEQIREFLRSRYAFTKLQLDTYSDLDILGNNDGSLLSLMESYSSGSTLSHYCYPRQWRIQSLPVSQPPERKLDPVVEVSSETESASDTSIPKVLSTQFDVGDNEIIIVDRKAPTSPCSMLPNLAPRSTVGLRMDVGCRNQQKLVGAKEHCQGTAPLSVITNASSTAGVGRLGVQRKVSGVSGTCGIATDVGLRGMTSNKNQLLQAGIARRVMPQKF